MNLNGVDEIRVERGIKRFERKRRAFVFGTNALEWLLGSSPRDWSAIYVAHSSGLDPLLEKVMRRMNAVDSSPEDWREHSSSCDVLHGAGDGDDLDKNLGQLISTVPTLLICPSGSSTRKCRGTSWPLHHNAVGGATVAKGRLWTADWRFVGLPVMVRRQVGHFIDHGTLPTACSRAPDFLHLTTQDLLPMSGKLPPIVFPTHATRTKW
jgi:hypothetical protein